MEIVQNLFRTLMFFLDNIVYGLIPEIYKIFVYLSELNLYGDSSSPIQKLVSHIYVLLGIFMLFKISFSLLQYIVDPSAFRDSSKGMGKLVTNVLVTLVLLVSVPFIFDKAMDLQTEIVQSNVIGQLILGTSMGDLQSDDESNNTIQEVEKRAKDVQFMMFGAFYSLNPAVTENEQFNGCTGKSGVFGAIDMATEDCLNDLNEAISGYDDASANGVTLYSFFKHGTDGTDDRDFSHFDKLLWWKVDGNYVINYLPFISTAAGIYVVFLLITFCVDIAVRTIKLCFLQMIAPIAIVSYIDPKESISNGKLSAWIKECASTYFSLFLRLATIFLVILLISVISSSILADGGYISGQINSNKYNIWLYLFLIIGAFMFAKQVPKIIESIFGIKGSGEFSLNPLKNAGFAALAGGAVGLGIGAAGALTGSGKGRFVTGALGGFKSGLTGKKIGEISNMQADINRRAGMTRANGSTFVGRMGARISSTLGTPGAMGSILNQKRDFDREIKEYENQKQAVENEIAPTRMIIAKNSATASELDAIRARAVKKIEEGNGVEGAKYQEYLRKAAAAETAGDGERAEKLRQDANRLKHSDWADSWVTTNLNSDDGDKGVKSLYMKAQASAEISGHRLSADGKVLDGISKKISGDNTELQIKISRKEQDIKEFDDKIRDVRVKKSELDEPEQKARADIEAVQGKEGGARRRGGFGGPGFGGPGGPGFGGPGFGGPRGPRR